MLKAPTPSNESSRLKDLQAFEILDTEPEKDYDDLVELVSQICNCPMAIVNFIDNDRQWFKAAKNMPGPGGNRADSFCGHAIMDNELFVVSDATKDERFFDNPDVIGGLHVRFYAGAPIISSNGYNLGTVCAIDKEPKQISRQQRAAMKTIAKQVSRLLDLRMKNKQIVQTARSLVSAQKKIAQMNMSEQESQNYQTAYILHEEIAQALSAVKFYIDHARNDQNLSEKYLLASIEELNSLTNNITNLSKELTPTTFVQDNYQSHIEKLVSDFQKKEHIEIQFQFSGDETLLNRDKGLMIFRIIQDLLRYCNLSGSRDNRLNFVSKDGLSIKLEFRPQKLMLENQRMMIHENIINRVEMLGGKFEKNSFEGGQSEIQIMIPADPGSV